MHCPVCQSSKTSILPPYYHFEGLQYDLYRCRHCGNQFVCPVPSDETLAKMYGKEYFERDFHCGHSSHSAFDHQETCFPEWYRQLVLQPPARILEVGCATGYQLKVFQEAGFQCTGIEFSQEAAEYARTAHGLDVITGSVLTAQLPEASFDLIYLHDVFEHIAAPVETLQRLFRWLKSGGFLVIVIPTQTNTLFSRIGMSIFGILGKRIHVTLPPYHLFEYRPNTIRRLLTVQGFYPIRLEPSIMKPSQIALRGSGLQKTIKKWLHYPNYVLTQMTGLYGDRLMVIAEKARKK